MRKSRILLSVAAIVFAGSLHAQGVDPGRSHRVRPRNAVGNPDVNVALEWNSVALTALQAAKVPPTVAARILAIAHGAMYDAWAPFDTTAVATLPGGAARQPSSANTINNKSEAISYAAYRTLLQLIPSQQQLIVNTMVSNLEYDPGVTTTSGSAPAAIGNLAAALQLSARAGDGANQSGGYADTTGYQPVNSPTLITDPNHWQPLVNPDGTTQTFVTPQWGQVAPFALQSGNQFRPSQPPQAGNWLYGQRMRDALEENSELDDESKMSAEYWEDATGTTSTAVGHWNLIGAAVSNRDQHTLDQDTLMFFALNEALLDTSISIWDAKRAFDSIRPVSVIHYYMNGQTVLGWNGPGAVNGSIQGASWLPWLSTPSFPEYPSDKAGFANAAAETFRFFTGSDVIIGTEVFAPGSSTHDPGNSPTQTVTLGWFTFSEIASDASSSAGPGGVQFEDAALQGGLMGRAVADATWTRYQKLLSGSR